MQALPKTIDEVISTLDNIIEDATINNNYNAVFAYVYRRTTWQIKASIKNGEFEDNDRMETFDVFFANLYIKAYYDHKNGLPISKCWEVTFNAGKQKMSLMQHILLGMSAHINFDLGVTAAHTSNNKDIYATQNDFRKINSILAGLTNEIQKRLGKVSPMLFLLDLMGGVSDEKIANFSIKIAREQSWLFALNLWQKNDKDPYKNEIDFKVANLGQKLIQPPGILIKFILKIISVFETKSLKRIIANISE